MEIKESIGRGIRDFLVKHEELLGIIVVMYVIPALIALPIFYIRFIK